MVLNSIGSALLQELSSDNAVVGHQLKSGGGRFETLLMQRVVNPWDSLLQDVVAQKTCRD